MDLLCNVYSNPSENEEEEEEEKAEGIKQTITPPNPNRLKSDNPFAHTKFHHPLPESTQFPTLEAEALVPGRYISKRKRALLASQPTVPDPQPNPNAPAAFGSISDSDVPRDVMLWLRNKAKRGRSQLGQLPQRMSVALNKPTKAVNASTAHLLASASMDHTICIWNVWSSDQKVARVFNFHNAVVKDVKWSLQGLSVLSCVYDSSSRLVDIEKGLEIQVFKEDQVVSVIRFRQFHSVKILLFFGMFRDKFRYLIR
ncbi:uncharacterized protein LOC125468403 [Pyrus x bretschneideri]|uniref:uncharacterized protein LOC125468403 n=1 Tax=Pyrus x bretschneideri TaxID=225117 RepID=UPI002030085D|nr:uncharacterized protein LOC125468403 [Pyrus x bretschneideri]